MSENLFLEMKNYSFFFDDERFDIDFVPSAQDDKLYELHQDDTSLFILVPLANAHNDHLKVFYPKKSYELLLSSIKTKLIWYFFILTIIAAFISLLFSFYALSPMRKALKLLEEFIKDIIHDLNTPVTAILINLKMIEQKSEEIQSIEQSTKTISMLHKNLDTYLRESHLQKEKLSINAILDEQIKLFQPLYSYLEWDLSIVDFTVLSDRNSLSRIIYNLLNNACKYNSSHGFIKISAKNSEITITNSSYGIKNPEKVFDRFYKESDRGLGIGLHIVEKLCDELGIEKKLEAHGNIVSVHLIF